MRKNAVNQPFIPLDGGIQAVDGFSCLTAILPRVQTLFSSPNADSITIISAEKRSAFACLLPENTVIDEYTILSKAHAKNGYIKALLLSDCNVVNVQASSQANVKGDFRLLADKFSCNVKEICAVNVGKVGSQFFDVSRMETAEFISSKWQQFGYAFYLGDVLCRIGAIFIGGDEHSRQMGAQSTVCCIITDVNITPQMLEKAFVSAAEDTLECLYMGAERSPNDFYGFLSSCQAKNYIISQTDSEYKKFFNALKRVLQEIVLRITENNQKKRLFCLVEGARSKQTAKALANAVCKSASLQQQAYYGNIKVESLLCALCGAGERLALERMQIHLRSAKGEIVLFDYGKQTEVDASVVAQTANAKDVYIEVRLHGGYYKANALAVLGER